MPRQTAKSGLADRLGKKLRDAHNKHKDDETRLGGGGDLPAGIEGGVAQLIKAGFGQYKEGPNQGKDYYMARFVVKSPFDFNGEKIEGRQFNIGPLPLCDTPNAKGKKRTFDDHYDFFLNELRLEGIETADLNEDDLEAAVAQLEEDQPHIKFRTWQGQPTEAFPNPRVNVENRGVCEYNGQVHDEVEDNSGGEEPEADEPEPDEPEAEEQEEDVQDLAKRADRKNSDKAAAARLVDIAKELGVDYEAADDWAGVAEAIEEARAGGSSGAADSDWEPSVEEVYLYTPPGKDPKTKRAYKAVECEVIKVYGKTKKCDLKNLDDGKTIYKVVPWDQLEQG